MQSLVESGTIADIILALIAAEIVGLVLLSRLLGLGPRFRSIAATLASGAFLVLALRSALTSANWEWTAAWLAAALLSHIVDLAGRWKT